MKIIIIQGFCYPIPPLLGGAVEKIWFSLAKEFVRLGHEVIYISRLYNGLAQKEKKEGILHIRVKGFDMPRNIILMKMYDMIYTLRVIKLLKKESIKGDIVVPHTFWFPILVRDDRFGKVYVHIARYPKGQAILYPRTIGRLQTVSSPLKEVLQRQVPSLKNKIIVIPNPLPYSEESIGNKDFSLRKNLVLYVGRVHPEKGIEILIESFLLLLKQGLNEWKCKIVGPWEKELGGGGKKYYNTLKKAIEGYEDYIEFEGNISQWYKLKSIYQEAKIFVYPSVAEYGESFGLAVLEAMANGCCVVVSDLKCFKDFVEDRINGLVFNHRSNKACEELAEKVFLLITQPTLQHNISQNAYQTSKKFLLSNIAKRYIEDFSRCINM